MNESAANVEQYHVHIYFDDQRENLAQTIRVQADSNQGVSALGRMHTGPVGPHPCRQFQLLVPTIHLPSVLDWLDRVRSGLSVLIHPDIEDDWAAHTTHARWLGDPVELKLETLLP